MGKLTNEEIIKRISKKNDKVEVLGIQRITKKGNSKIVIKLKCECGITFIRELNRLFEKKSKCLCKNCTQKSKRELRIQTRTN